MTTRPIADGRVEITLKDIDEPKVFFFSDIDSWEVSENKPGWVIIKYPDRSFRVEIPIVNIEQITVHHNSQEYMDAMRAWWLERHQLNHPNPDTNEPQFVPRCPYCTGQRPVPTPSRQRVPGSLPSITTPLANPTDDAGSLPAWPEIVLEGPFDGKAPKRRRRFIWWNN